MAWYAVGVLRDLKMRPPVVKYLERIDATLAAFDGHFLIHGGKTEMLEGQSPGILIVIEFPDYEHAQQWYSSPAYQEILPLRRQHSVSTTFLAEGVDRTHKAVDVLLFG
jgi:uncharacterized protein (DUF1330 family)